MGKVEGVQGVWRTIGGRRVFIKDGQSLSDAMKESGKFKKNQIKNAEIDKVDNPYATNNKGGIDDNSSEFADRAIKHWESENAKYKEKYGKDDEMAKSFKERWEKEKNNRVHGEQKAKEKETTAPDSYKDSMITSRNNDEVIRDLNNRKEQLATHKDRYTPEEYKKQENGLNEGIRYAKQQKETSANKDRETFNKIAKFYGYDKMDNDAIRRTLDDAEKKGLYHSKGDIEAMRRYLDKTLIEKDTGSAYSKPGKRWEVLEKDKSAYGKDIYKVRDEEGNVQWKDASAFYEKRNNQINDTLRRKAYQKYLKEHPNSKMKFEDFIK